MNTLVIRQETSSSLEADPNPSYASTGSRSPTVSGNVVGFWKSSFASASKGGFVDLDDFVVRLQAVGRTRLSKERSTSPQLTLTRYARAEAAVRLALAQCEKEPTPFQLQVRIMERGLRVWQARVSRGYERVKRADGAIQVMREEQEKGHFPAGHLPDLQREKWMGMKERDEALDMVTKIKALILALNQEIKAGSKRSSLTPLPNAPSLSRTESDEPTTPSETNIVSKKASILFSGRIQPPYLENLPRSRQSVEALQLPERQRQRASLSAPSTPSIPPDTPATPEHGDTEYGAVLLHAPISVKTMAQLLAEMENQERSLGHVQLPSYVDTLLDELSTDRVGSQAFDISTESLLPLASSSSSNTGFGSSSNGHQETTPARSKTQQFLHRSTSIIFNAKENFYPSPSDQGLNTPRRKLGQIEDPVTPGKKHGKMEHMMRSMKKKVKRVSSKLGDRD